MLGGRDGRMQLSIVLDSYIQGFDIGFIPVQLRPPEIGYLSAVVYMHDKTACIDTVLLPRLCNHSGTCPTLYASAALSVPAII